MPADDVNQTIVLYCHNDGCSVRSQRYIMPFPPNRCPECGSKFEKQPQRRETHIRGNRSFDNY